MAIIPDRYIDFGKEVAKMTSFKVVMAYLTIVTVSPVLRKFTNPLSLKRAMLFYNVVCVALSGAALIILCGGILNSGNVFDMQPNSVIKMGLFIYLISKYVELLDTIIMVLRHKQRQISFLHVYHHSTILLLGDYSYRFAPWPPVAVMVGMNSLVHVFLYAYYAKTAISSNVSQKWKERLTQLQIVQFFIGLMLCTKGYLYHGFCIHGIFYGLSMILLFSNFYYWAYVSPPRDSKKKQ